MKEKLLANMPPQMIKAANGDVIKILAMLPQEQLTKITEEINKSFEANAR